MKRAGVLAVFFSFPNSVWERWLAKLRFDAPTRNLQRQTAGETELRGRTFPNGVWERVWERGILTAFLAILTLLAAPSVCRADDNDPLHRTLGTLPEFKLTDQNGNTIQREQLLGKVCVVSVFFSCCTSFCPTTQQAMAALQEKLAGYPDVLLVSINVYPDHDTPSIISDYAKARLADPARWLFLHGDKKEIYDLVQKGFFQGLEENATAAPGNEVSHTPNFLVVDHRGVIRGYVDAREPAEVERLEGFVKQLVQAKYLPTINATLNGSCGVFLVMGFLFIRKRWVAAHKICMLVALGVSAAFLACYLYYHFALLNGEPTRFQGEGPIRSVYLAILLSHTVLAVLVAPLALRVTYLGLRNRLPGHRALARWTLPIWLYVSVTGVVVYWMLYQLYPPV